MKAIQHTVVNLVASAGTAANPVIINSSLLVQNAELEVKLQV